MRDKEGFEADRVSDFQELEEGANLPESLELRVRLPSTEDAMVGMFLLCWRIEAVEKEGRSRGGHGG